MNNKFGGFSEFAIDFEMHTGREKYVTAAPAALRKARLFMFVPFTYLLLYYQVTVHVSRSTWEIRAQSIPSLKDALRPLNPLLNFDIFINSCQYGIYEMSIFDKLADKGLSGCSMVVKIFL
jgi:hypothetical protein